MSPAVDERSDARTLDVIVIGAGQAGLAAGYFLQQAGVRFRMFESAARIGDSWRRRYDSLVLFSPRSHSALPGMTIDGDPRGYPTKDEIANYLEQYATALRLPVALQEGIARLERVGHHFVGRTTRGRHVASRTVIVATGAFQRNAVPSWAASVPAGTTQLRADGYRNPRQLPAGRVLVVGGGGSGRQIALEIAGSHDVSLSLGRPITITPQRVLGRDVMVWFDRLGLLRADKATTKGRFVRGHESFPGPHLRDRALLRLGVHILPRTVSAAADGVAFADGSQASFDAVIWAGGYGDDASWLCIPGAVGRNGRHLEDRGASPVPGLFYVGRSWQTCRASALLCGVGRDAASVVARATAWLPHAISATAHGRLRRGSRDEVSRA